MTVWIEDSPRNLASWIETAMQSGIASGAVITPFATPRVAGGQGSKRTAAATVSMLTLPGRSIWFDPMTHALQMSAVGDFRFYDQYDLWANGRGDLSTPALITEHVRKVFTLQDELGVPHLAPTVLLHTGLSQQSVLALDIAREATAQDPDCAIAVAGSSSFWSSGTALDAHIGALSALGPLRWILTAVRSIVMTPVPTTADETFGLCRTVRALAEDGEVHISHGDFTALPAIAAGATSIGTGWDQRQRQCSQTDYQARDSSVTGGGGWFERPSLRGIIGSVSRNDAELLRSQAPLLLEQLGGIPAPGPNEAFTHHTATLGALVREIAAQQTFREKFEYLTSLYHNASLRWAEVQQVTRSAVGSDEWIAPLQAGLAEYGREEGF